MTSSTLKSSRFSMTVATGKRVSRNTHAPLTLPGMLSTAGHWDQSRVAIFLVLFSSSLCTTVRGRRHARPLADLDQTTMHSFPAALDRAVSHRAALEFTRAPAAPAQT